MVKLIGFRMPLNQRLDLLIAKASFQHLERLNVQSFAACESSIGIPSGNGSFPATTMTSADSLTYRNTEPSSRSPQVIASSFPQSLPDLHTCSFGILRALQRCDCLPKQICLISGFCPSVPSFVVLDLLFIQSQIIFSASLTRNHLAAY